MTAVERGLHHGHDDLPKLDAMTPEVKRALLRALLLDLAPTDGFLNGLDFGDRSVYVYTPPPNARENAERFIREADPAYLDELHRRAAEDSEVMSLEEVLALKPDSESGSTPQS